MSSQVKRLKHIVFEARREQLSSQSDASAWELEHAGLMRGS